MKLAIRAQWLPEHKQTRHVAPPGAHLWDAVIDCPTACAENRSRHALRGAGVGDKRRAGAAAPVASPE